MGFIFDSFCLGTLVYKSLSLQCVDLQVSNNTQNNRADVTSDIIHHHTEANGLAGLPPLQLILKYMSIINAKNKNKKHQQEVLLK